MGEATIPINHCERRFHDFDPGLFRGTPEGDELEPQFETGRDGTVTATEVCWRCLTRRVTTTNATQRIARRYWYPGSAPSPSRICGLMIPPHGLGRLVPVVPRRSAIVDLLDKAELVTITLPRVGAVVLAGHPVRGGLSGGNICAGALARSFGWPAGAALPGTVLFAGWAGGKIVDLPDPVVDAWNKVRDLPGAGDVDDGQR